jgi:hypothetical protein
LIHVNGETVTEKHQRPENRRRLRSDIANPQFIFYLELAAVSPAVSRVAGSSGLARDGMSEQRGGFARYLPLATVAALIITAVLVVESAAPARALPSYARQTGQPCGSCHTDFAGLTPYGRRFKIGGYTYGGGPYRTSPFSFDDSTENWGRPWVPPISMMSTVGFTHNATEISPPADPYANNDNISIPPTSFFWGGAITDHIGAFAQLTYTPTTTASIGSDPFRHSWAWDNTDVRFADSTSIGNVSITYGITANNNPTVQDPWNTTPAWQFPYALSPFTAGFGPTPIIDSHFGPGFSGSVGGYAYVNDLIYLEASVYRTLPPSAQNDLGEDPFDTPGLFDAAPYWRVAFEPHWGRNWLEVGTFGMVANVHPWVNIGTPDTSVFSQTDKYTDIGVDSQYQYQGDNFWFTLRGSYIHEIQKLDASFLNGLSANPQDDLNEARAYASLAYGNDNRIVLTGQYFTAWGSPDSVIYSSSPNFSPDTNGWIAEIAYIPFISSFAPGWPWLNARIGLQYTWYERFNGTSAGASTNNGLFAYVWLAM